MMAFLFLAMLRGGLGRTRQSNFLLLPFPMNNTPSDSYLDDLDPKEYIIIKRARVNNLVREVIARL
jgi:hypothetical protein